MRTFKRIFLLEVGEPIMIFYNTGKDGGKIFKFRKYFSDIFTSPIFENSLIIVTLYAFLFGPLGRFIFSITYNIGFFCFQVYLLILKIIYNLTLRANSYLIDYYFDYYRIRTFLIYGNKFCIGFYGVLNLTRIKLGFITYKTRPDQRYRLFFFFVRWLNNFLNVFIGLEYVIGYKVTYTKGLTNYYYFYTKKLFKRVIRFARIGIKLGMLVRIIYTKVIFTFKREWKYNKLMRRGKRFYGLYEDEIYELFETEELIKVFDYIVEDTRYDYKKQMVTNRQGYFFRFFFKYPGILLMDVLVFFFAFFYIPIMVCVVLYLIYTVTKFCIKTFFQGIIETAKNIKAGYEIFFKK